MSRGRRLLTSYVKAVVITGEMRNKTGIELFNDIWSISATHARGHFPGLLVK